MEPILYTIGHSNKPIKEFVEKLSENKIGVLVDVRTAPYSKYNPQFNREALKMELEKAGITYIYKGKNLGGKGENIDWNSTIQRLCDRVKENKTRICVMCSEGDPEKCHRKTKIEPAVLAHNVEIAHILWSFNRKDLLLQGREMIGGKLKVPAVMKKEKKNGSAQTMLEF